MVPKRSLLPSFPDPRLRRAVREALSVYGESELCSQLGASRWQDLASMERTELRSRVAALSEPFRSLVELFHLGLAIDRSRGEAALGAGVVGALEVSSMLEADGTHLRPTVRLAAVEDLIFAYDVNGRHHDREADYVLGAGGATRSLGDLTLRAPVGSVLDLGCGAGILGCLCAAHATRVVATDINARAVEFSRFNAELNGLEGVECRKGSLFEPVAGERFDLIVCNPPYVISPEATFLYRDGGSELSRSIVRSAADHLTPTGTLQMMMEWPEREGRDWRDEVTSWLDGAGCHAWLLRLYSDGARRYAARWLGEDYAGGEIPDAAVEEWAEYLRGLGIHSVGGGHLVLKPAGNQPPHAVLRDAPPIVGSAGPSLGRWLECQQLLRGLDDDVELLDTVLSPSPDLERIDRRSPTGAGWSTSTSQLRLRSGLTFGARVDPVATEIVGLLDGVRTPREALTAFCQEHGLSVEPFQGGLPGALRRLVDLSLLVPEG